MAHELSIQDNGFVEFVSANGKSARHFLGQRCNEALTWEEAVQFAGLDWSVYKEP